MTALTNAQVADAVVEYATVFLPLGEAEIMGTAMEVITVAMVDAPCNDAQGQPYDDGYMRWLDKCRAADEWEREARAWEWVA